MKKKLSFILLISLLVLSSMITVGREEEIERLQLLLKETDKNHRLEIKEMSEFHLNIINEMEVKYKETNNSLVKEYELQIEEANRQNEKTIELFEIRIKKLEDKISMKKEKEKIEKNKKEIETVKAQPKKEKKVAAVSSETFVITAYTAGYESTGKRPGDVNYGKMANGKKVYKGAIACPPEYAFGTTMKIEGMGVYECSDRGGDIKGKRLDIYMKSLNKALNFGRQTLRVEIIS